MFVALDCYDAHGRNSLRDAIGETAKKTILLERDLDGSFAVFGPIISPIVGVAAGGAVNIVFMESFQKGGRAQCLEISRKHVTDVNPQNSCWVPECVYVLCDAKDITAMGGMMERDE